MKNKYPKPKIIRERVRNNPYEGKPYYYSIVYYDVFNNEYINGYGSYNKKFVKEWLKKEFITVTRLDLQKYANINLFDDVNKIE